MSIQYQQTREATYGGAADKLDEDGGGKEETQRTTVTKAQSGKHFPRTNQSTNDGTFLTTFQRHARWLPHAAKI